LSSTRPELVEGGIFLPLFGASLLVVLLALLSGPLCELGA
jgi:hypothetical protein